MEATMSVFETPEGEWVATFSTSFGGKLVTYRYGRIGKGRWTQTMGQEIDTESAKMCERMRDMLLGLKAKNERKRRGGK